jgi:hypothetical protein
MPWRRSLPRLLLIGLLLLLGTACSAAPEASAPLATPTPEQPGAAAPTEAFLFPSVTPPAIANLPTSTPQIELPGESTPETPQPAIPESRRLTLEFPPVIRTGDSARIRLQLEVDAQGNITPTAVVEGNVVTGEVVQIPNLYETHNVIAEANLDMAGVQVQPPGIISEPLLQGQSVTFYWSVRPAESGKYEGTVWLHLRFIPKGGGEESRIPVSAQFLEIESKSFMGFLNGGTARGIGAVGSVIGSVLGFPFVDDFIKWLWGKIKRK